MQPFPKYDKSLLTDSTIVYPVAVNCKVRTKIEVPYDTSENNIKQYVMDNGTVRRWINGVNVNRIIIIKGKMINVVTSRQ